MTIEAIDVPCPSCNAFAGMRCRGISDWLTNSRRRCHRARTKRRDETVQMHRLAVLLLFDEWPMPEQLEYQARLGVDADDRQRASMLLDFIERTGYDGDLYAS